MNPVKSSPPVPFKEVKENESMKYINTNEEYHQNLEEDNKDKGETNLKVKGVMNNKDSEKEDEDKNEKDSDVEVEEEEDIDEEEEEEEEDIDEDEDGDMLYCDVCNESFPSDKVADFDGPHSYQPCERFKCWTACIDCIEKHNITCEYGSNSNYEFSSFCEVCDLYFPSDEVKWFNKPFKHKGYKLYSACEKCRDEHNI